MNDTRQTSGSVVPVRAQTVEEHCSKQEGVASVKYISLVLAGME